NPHAARAAVMRARPPRQATPAARPRRPGRQACPRRPARAGAAPPPAGRGRLPRLVPGGPARRAPANEPRRAARRARPRARAEADSESGRRDRTRPGRASRPYDPAPPGGRRSAPPWTAPALRRWRPGALGLPQRPEEHQAPCLLRFRRGSRNTQSSLATPYHAFRIGPGLAVELDAE